jgi:hypothetical protein
MHGVADGLNAGVIHINDQTVVHGVYGPIGVDNSGQHVVPPFWAKALLDHGGDPSGPRSGGNSKGLGFRRSVP